jgi:hypothetical protein
VRQLVAAATVLAGLLLPSSAAAAASGSTEVDERLDCIESVVVTRASSNDPSAPTYLAALPQGVGDDVGLDELIVRQGPKQLEVQVLGRVDPKTLHVAIVVDTTPVRASVRRAEMLVAAGIATTLPRGARVGVIDAANPEQVVFHLSRRHKAVAAAIRALAPRTSNRARRLLDAIGTAGSVLGSEPGRSRALIVITTGADGASTFGTRAVERQLTRARTSVTVVDAGPTAAFPEASSSHPSCAVGADPGTAWGVGRQLGTRFGTWLRFTVLEADPGEPIEVEIPVAGTEPMRAVEVPPVPPLPPAAASVESTPAGGRGLAVGVLALPGVLAVVFLSLGYLMLTAGRTSPLPDEVGSDPASGTTPARRALPPLVRGRSQDPGLPGPRRRGGTGLIDLRTAQEPPLVAAGVPHGPTRSRSGPGPANGTRGLLSRAGQQTGATSVLDRMTTQSAVRRVPTRGGPAASRLGRDASSPSSRGTPPARSARSVENVVATARLLHVQTSSVTARLAPSRRARALWRSGVALALGASAVLLARLLARPSNLVLLVGAAMVLAGLGWLRHATTPPYHLLRVREPEALAELDDRTAAAEHRALEVAATDAASVPSVLDLVARLREEYVRGRLATYRDPVRGSLVPALFLMLPGLLILLLA